MSTASELACSYACIILHDDGIPITAEKINTLTKAANVTVEPYWPGLFVKLAESKNLDDIILNVGTPAAAPAAAAPAAAAAEAAAPAKEEKKEEPEESSDEDMGLGLFD